MSFVEFDSVSKIYGTGATEIRAADEVSFSFEKGEFVVIVGQSGAGKTTVLSMLGGMDSCTSGRIFVDGSEISSYSAKQLAEYRRYDVGFVFQFYNLVQNLSALENIELASQICRNPLSAADTLADVGLADRGGNFPSQLSGGEQQRVALARALVNSPDILLADEPTGNLDPKTSREIMKLLEEINARGTTVLVVTHDQAIVNTMKKRVIRMQKGIITEDEKESGYIG